MDLLQVIEKLSKHCEINLDEVRELKSKFNGYKTVFLNKISDFVKNKNSYVDDNDSNEYLFPLILLSEMNVTEIFPMVVEMFTVSEAEAYYLYDEFIKNDLPTVLFRTYNGDYKLLESLIFNKKVDTLIRIQALMTFMKLGSIGKIKWIVVLNLVNKITRNMNKDNLSDSEIDILTHTAVFIAEFHLISLLKVMTKIINSDNFDQSVCGEYEVYIDKMFTYESSKRISNIIDNYKFETRAYVNRLYTFTEDYQIDKSERPFVDEVKEAKKKEMFDNFIESCKFVKPDIQKNDLCYCGSGKKYKRCCIKEPNEKYVYKPLSNYYDLLIDYPQVENIDGKKGLLSVYTMKTIEMDKWFFKAFHYVPIPNYIPHDYYDESLIKAGYILNGLEIAYEIIEEEKIQSEDEFNDKFMIHYDILTCSNAAYKMIHDNNYPLPQLNSRIDNLFYLINAKLK